MKNIFYYLGRPDGIGNRIEELISISEYCEKNNKKCIYIWRNTNFRKYKPEISFDNIEIRNAIKDEERLMIVNNYKIIRNFNYNVKYKFNFNISEKVKYDAIIHIRGTDRLSKRNNHGDFSNEKELNNYIKNTINYVNNSHDILTYTIVSDDKKYILTMKNKLNKQFVELPYDYTIDNDWLDFYYLTIPRKYVIMCCKFSSFSICASILGKKKLLVFKNSLNSNLNRYKADLHFMD